MCATQSAHSIEGKCNKFILVKDDIATTRSSFYQDILVCTFFIMLIWKTTINSTYILSTTHWRKLIHSRRFLTGSTIHLVLVTYYLSNKTLIQLCNWFIINFDVFKGFCSRSYFFVLSKIIASIASMRYMWLYVCHFHRQFVNFCCKYLFRLWWISAQKKNKIDAIETTIFTHGKIAEEMNPIKAWLDFNAWRMW